MRALLRLLAVSVLATVPVSSCGTPTTTSVTEAPPLPPGSARPLPTARLAPASGSPSASNYLGWIAAHDDLGYLIRPWLIGSSPRAISELGNVRDWGPPLYRAGYAFFPDRGLTPIVQLNSGDCDRAGKLEPGFPILGRINLNDEPDKIFGRRSAPSRRVPILNPHPGRRYLVGLGGTESSAWAVVSRARVHEVDAVTSELYRWNGSRWTQEAGTNQLGVDWPYVAARGGRLVVAERRQVRSTQETSSRTSWRFRLLDIDRTPNPTSASAAVPTIASRPDLGACAEWRIRSLYAFASGEIITTGATCDRALVVERYGTDRTPAAAAVIRQVETDDQGLGYEMDVVSPSLIRLRTSGGHAYEARYAEGEWHVGATTATLRQDALLRALRARYGLRFRLEHTFVFPSQVFAAGVLRDGDGDGESAVLFTDHHVKQPCDMATTRAQAEREHS